MDRYGETSLRRLRRVGARTRLGRSTRMPASLTFRLEHERTWRNLESLVSRVERRGVQSLNATELNRLPLLYRSTLSSLSVARSVSLDRNVLQYLEGLANRAYFSLYAPRRSWFAVAGGFLFGDFAKLLRAHRWHLALSFAFLLCGILIGRGMTLNDQENFYAFVSDGVANGRTPASTTEELRAVLFSEGHTVERLQRFTAFLFTHNAQIGLYAFSFGILFGVPVFFLLCNNGLSLGAFAGLYESRGLGYDFWGWVLPHGITELLAVLVCAAAGLRLAQGIVFPGCLSRMDALRSAGGEAAQLALGAILMFLLAALIEGFFRQNVLDTTIRFGVAGASVCVWFFYVSFAGRRWR